MPIEITDKYLRIRLKDPKLFSKIRTQDVGRKGHSKRLAGYNRKTKEWETQAWLINRKDLKSKDPKAYNLIFGILSEVPFKERPALIRALKKLV